MAWGEKIDGVMRYDCHQAQWEVLEAKQRFVAAIAGTGGGKTVLGPLWLAREINAVSQTRNLYNDPFLGFVVAPTYDVLSRATIPTLVRTLKGTALEGQYIPSKRRYVLPRNLGQLWLLSADSPGGLEGGQIDAVWIDEAGQLKYEAWVAIRGRLGVKRSRALVTTTPYARNWLFHKWFAPALRDKNQGEYFVKQWSSVANPAYSQEEFASAKRDLPEQRFSMRYEANFCKLAGLVYPDFEERCKVPNQTPPSGQLFGGLDFGFNDPFVGLVAVRDGKDILHVFRERYQVMTPIEVHATEMPKGVTYFADPAQPEQIMKMRLAGHSIKPNRARNIMAGIDAVSTRLYAGKLKIYESCSAIFKEAAEYSYTTDEHTDEDEGDKPIDDFNHALDALRYLVVNIDKKVRKVA